MPYNFDSTSDRWQKDLEKFKENGFDEADLKEYYSNAYYIKYKRFKNKKTNLYLDVDDFLEFYNFISNYQRDIYSGKLFLDEDITFSGILKWFRALYINDFGFWDAKNKKNAINEWYEKYNDKKKRSNPSTSLTKSEKIPSTSLNGDHSESKKNIFLLAIEESQLPIKFLTKLQKNEFSLNYENFNDFYRLPWIWHYGGNEDAIKLKDFISKSAQIEDEKASDADGVIENPANFIFLELELNGRENLELKPGLSVSAMDAAFAKIKGKTFKMLGAIDKSQMPKLPVNFYRMP